MKSVLLFICICIASALQAQQAPIMVCDSSGNLCNAYYDLDTAIVYAPPTSIVYLPGGSFALHFPLAKEVHIVGTGHYPDSTIHTGISQIAGDIILTTGSDHSSFEGLYLINSFKYNQTLQHIKVIRCNLEKLEPMNGNITFNHAVFVQCVVRDFLHFGETSPLGTNNTVANCILRGVQRMTNSMISNNIFFASPGMCNSSFLSVASSTFKNNIFYDIMGGSGTWPCFNPGNYYNTFLHNLTTQSGGTSHSPLVEVSTMTNVPDVNLFANASGSGFSYSKDFHLKPTCVGINAGDDNTDVGIYGSNTPYKEAAVPGNPHIYFKNVGGSTTNEGNLPVLIKVRTEN